MIGNVIKHKFKLRKSTPTAMTREDILNFGLLVSYKAFHDTKLAGIHDTIMPPPKSFASELLGLLSRSTLHDNKKPRNTKVKETHEYKGKTLIYARSPPPL